MPSAPAGGVKTIGRRQRHRAVGGVDQIGEDEDLDELVRLLDDHPRLRAEGDAAGGRRRARPGTAAGAAAALAAAPSPAMSTTRRPPDAGCVNGCETSRSPSTVATAV